jgi:tartrate/fumarate subfamily iron-sulfur-dependent hydro-lyase alpha chain
MENRILKRDLLSEAMYQTVVRASTSLPRDVKSKLLEYLQKERHALARFHLETIMKNCALGEERGRVLCPDTGYPLFYIRTGDRVKVEGGWSILYEAAKEAVEKATAAGQLRPNMVHPITRKNPGTNTGPFIPDIEVRFDPEIDFMEITAIPKGGGGEIFGTFFKMMVPADGKQGIFKFILDSMKESTYAGKTCPPNIVGVGIGGTTDLCMRIAKQAAVLRPIGSRHPEPEIASWEEDLVESLKDSGIGPMGMGGGSGILDLHIEYAACHTAGLPVAFNAQCCLARRKTARVIPEGEISYHDFPEWNYR